MDSVGGWRTFPAVEIGRFKIWGRPIFARSLRKGGIRIRVFPVSLVQNGLGRELALGRSCIDCDFGGAPVRLALVASQLGLRSGQGYAGLVSSLGFTCRFSWAWCRWHEGKKQIPHR